MGHDDSEMITRLIAKLAAADQKLSFLRKELHEMAKMASDYHNAIVAYTRRNSDEHGYEDHVCEICDVARRTQAEIRIAEMEPSKQGR